MHIKEYMYLEEIKLQLANIQKLFYRDLKHCESHNELGRLYQFVTNIINITEEVETE